MGEQIIELDPKESQKIEQPSSGRKGNVIDVKTGSVLVSDNGATAAEGKELQEGDRVTVAQENGDPVHVYNPNSTTAKFSLNPDGLIIRFMSRVTQKVLSAVFPSISYGRDTVSTAGTAVALNGGTSESVPQDASVLIQALKGNGGNVYVGDSTVSSSDGYPLSAQQTLSLAVDDVSSIYIDADTGGDGVAWIVEDE